MITHDSLVQLGMKRVRRQPPLYQLTFRRPTKDNGKATLNVYQFTVSSPAWHVSITDWGDEGQEDEEVVLGQYADLKSITALIGLLKKGN